jgi:hypothetical protein
MNRLLAEEILDLHMHPDGGLGSYRREISWEPHQKRANLEGHFTADELEAIAWCMNNNKRAQK